MNTPTPHTRENPKLGNKKYGKKGGVFRVDSASEKNV